MNKPIDPQQSVHYDPSCMDDYDPSSMDANIAQQHILHSIQAIRATERVAIRAALHRVLAEDIQSSINVPGHTNSAMDGYAIRSQDIPSREHKTFTLIGTAWAGRPYQGEVNENQCVRIMTGAAMPLHADTVVMQEHVNANENNITIDAQQNAGQNVRQAGEDVARGETVFQAGKYIDPSDIGLIASLGIGEISVYRKPTVAFFSTGDELVSIGSELKTGTDIRQQSLYIMEAC